VVTKADLVDADRLAEVVGQVGVLLAGTSLAGSPILAVSAVGDERTGLDRLRGELEQLDRRVRSSIGDLDPREAPVRLAIDRVFSVKGRGAVVTGTLRGGSLARGATLRLVPGDRPARIRDIQVHGVAVEAAGPGRTALNVAGVEIADLGRGLVLTDDPAIIATDRVLARLSRPLPDRARARVHIRTAAVDAALSRSGRDAIELPDGASAGIVRLATPIAAAEGDRFVLRRASGAERVVGGVVLDTMPPRGISRRRQTPERVAQVAAALGVLEQPAPRSKTDANLARARLDLHGALARTGDRADLAADVSAEVDASVIGAVEAAGSDGLALPAARAAAVRALRRATTIDRDTAAGTAAAAIDRLATAGVIVRDGAVVRSPGVAARQRLDPELLAAMDRLEASLAVAAPPVLTEAAHAAGCPRPGIRELERAGRIVVLEPDLAYAMSTYGDLTAQALVMAARQPLTPAAFRDATGTSRKYVMAILADLDRRGMLRRTEAGHVPGPRAPSRPPPATPTAASTVPADR
jgi:selenocysteine-specific elongation factor